MRRLLWIWLALAASAGGAVTDDETASAAAGIRMAPASPSAAARRLMHRWHREYRDRIAPLEREWETLARTLRERPGSALTAGCRGLESALGDLDRARLPVAPDPSVSLHLEEALRSLAEAAVSCSHGGYFLTAWRLRQAEASWGELQARLRLHGLVP